MPLSQGHQWDYTVRSGFTSQVERVVITRSTSVASGIGYVIQGPMGTSILSWSGATLYAEDLPGTRFLPPVPLLNAQLESKTWSGTIRSVGGDQTGTGKLTHQEEDFKLSGSKSKSIKSVLTLDFSGRNRELTTWFIAGVGVVRQEERVQGELIRTIEYVSGP